MDHKVNTPDVQLIKTRTTEMQQHINVFVRVRPVNTYERSKHAIGVLDCPGTREVIVKDRVVTVSKTFTFDRVFGPNSKQIDVYKCVVAPLLEEVLLGYNCTVFAYGQTGTGKTYTMEGERSNDPELSWENDPQSGIIPRALSQLFDELRLQESEFTVRVSLLELYNEELFDLLSPNEGSTTKTLRVFEDSNRKGSVIIQGLEEVTVHNKQEVYKILEQGSIRRHTASTQINAKSSRSHTIFTMTVHIKECNVEGEELVKIGKLNLVDLAGSENIGRSGAVLKHAREAGSINQSLLTLGRVITALVEHTPHVPYRESKLTRLLQDSLGGRTKTSIIATVSPASTNLEETLSTLDYAHRAKDITNRPEINQKMTKRAVLKEYTEEIERLRRDLNACREKNGVFIESDNYKQLMGNLESMKDELASKILHQRTLEETIHKKDEELKTIQCQLEETQDDLQNCNSVLDETTKKLVVTRDELEMIRCERDQKSHLVEQHLKTEEELTAQAIELLSTTDDATSNLDKLYRKLDRKKTVEQKNLDAGYRFRAEITDTLTGVSEAIETLRVDHSEFCGRQRLVFEGFMTEKEMKVRDLKGMIDNFVELLSKTNVKGDLNSMVLGIHSLNKENIQNLEVLRDMNTNDLQSLLGKLTLEVSKVLNKINEMNSLFQNASKQYQKKAEEQLTMIKTFFSGRLEILSQMHETCEITVKSQEKRNNQLCMTVNRQQELLKANAAQFNLLKGCMSNFGNEYECFQQEMTSAADELKNSIEIEEFGPRAIYNVVEARTKNITKLSEELSTILEEDVQDLGDRVAKINTIMKSAERAAHIAVDNINVVVEKYSEKHTNSLTRFGEWTNTSCKKQSQEWNIYQSKFEEWEANFKNHTTEEMSTIKAEMEGMNTTVSELIDTAREDLGQHCTKISEWSEDIGENINEVSVKVKHFWDEKYLVDGPTGATPLRKAYVYPRLFSSTLPHERLIARLSEDTTNDNETNVEINEPEKPEIF